MESRPDLTLKQIAEKIRENFNIIVTLPTISNTLTKIGFTFKLLHTIPMGRNTEEVVLARKQFALNYFQEAPINREKIIWIDEVGYNLYLRRKQGRALKGARASITVPNSWGRNISICAAMSCGGFLLSKNSAVSTNTTEFCSFLRELFDYLRMNNLTNCWLILDNVKFYHSLQVNNLVRENGHSLIFLPPYSPMLNPIENLFSKWKSIIKTNNVVFNRDTLIQEINSAKRLITIDDCNGWIREINRNLSLAIEEHIFL